MAEHVIFLGVCELLPYFIYRGADKSLARPGRKQAAATENSAFHIGFTFS